jgi:hypothetical protein
LEGNWVEVDEVWTRREYNEFVKLRGDAYWTLWARKVVACRVELADGGVIDDPAALDEALVSELDLRLLRWLSTAVLTATAYLLNLGEASARLSLDGVGVAVQKKTNPTM